MNRDEWVACGFIVLVLIYALIEWPYLVSTQQPAPELRQGRLTRRRDE